MEMHSLNRKALPALVAATLVLGIPTASFAKPDQGTQPNNHTTQYKDWSDPAMGAVAVNAGRALVQHLRSAQSLLDEGSVPQARSALTDSRDFADALERMMPYLVVVEDLTNAKDRLLSEDVDVFYDDLLPIYASLDEMQVYAPELAQRAQNKVKHAEASARKGDTKGAGKTLQAVADEIAETTVYLPIDYVDSQIHAAMNALTRNPADVPLAKKAVSNALHSLTAVTVNGTGRVSDS